MEVSPLFYGFVSKDCDGCEKCRVWRTHEHKAQVQRMGALYKYKRKYNNLKFLQFHYLQFDLYLFPNKSQRYMVYS